jgi:hypothetical protein
VPSQSLAKATTCSLDFPGELAERALDNREFTARCLAPALPHSPFQHFQVAVYFMSIHSNRPSSLACGLEYHPMHVIRCMKNR